MLRYSLLCAAVLVALPAAAQNDAEADRLFQEARKLVREGKYGQACPKFAEAQRLRPGIGTLLNLADCYERQGKTASAARVFLDAAVAAEAAKDERAALARSRIESLEARLVKLAVVVPPESDVDGLEITLDGAPLPRERWGSEQAVDPGTYEIRATAPGKPAWKQQVDVLRGSVSVSVTFAQASAEAPATERRAAPLAMAEPAPADDRSLSTQQMSALAVAGIGSIGIFVGLGFGIASQNAKSEADDHCKLGPNGDLCDQTGVDAGDRAIARGNVATVAFIVGGAVIAAGAVLWFTAPDPEKSARSRRGVGLVPFGVRGVW